MIIKDIFDLHLATFNNYWSIWIFAGIIIGTLTMLDLEEDENILGLEMLDDDIQEDTEDE